MPRRGVAHSNHSKWNAIYKSLVVEYRPMKNAELKFERVTMSGI